MITVPLLMFSLVFIFRFAGTEASIAAPVYAASSDIPKAEMNIYDMKIPAPTPPADPATPLSVGTDSRESISKALDSKASLSESLRKDNTLLIPDIATDFKAYMDYRTITDEKAPQWKYRELAHTDDNGFRRIADDYVVALGTYYATGVGERFRVTLDTGVSFTVITGDIKDNKHTDPTNRYTPIFNGNKSLGGCVVEFLVDIEKLDKNAKLLGTVSYFDEFEGDIAKIEKL